VSSARQPVGAGVQLAVGPPPLALHRRDRVGVQAHPLLEQLVEAPVGQRPVRACQPVHLEPQLLGRQQAGAARLAVRVGDDHRKRGQVVRPDPTGGLGVQHVGPVAQP
jgi:hypothetical protein